MMKKNIVLLITLLTLLFPVSASAHLSGQPPFFKINGIYSNLYQVPVSSSPNFNLPQDLAAESYLANQNLSFEIDSKFLPVPQEVISQTKFNWDYGDGTKGSGLKNNHSYKEPKSYILTVSAQAVTDPQSTLIQSVMIHILPNRNYKLPIAIIKINNQNSKDPLTDILKADFSKEINFEGLDSKGGSSKIVSYAWDLGDTQTVTKPTLTHRYDQSLSQVFPVLRVVDEKGFITDNFVELENKANLAAEVKNEAEQTLGGSDSFQRQQLWVYGVAIIVSTITAAGVIKWLRSRKNSR